MPTQKEALHTEVALLRQTVEENTTVTKELLITLKGTNGNKGLVTRTNLLEAGQTRVWWWLGGVSLTLLGIAGWVIKSSFK